MATGYTGATGATGATGMTGAQLSATLKDSMRGYDKFRSDKSTSSRGSAIPQVRSVETPSLYSTASSFDRFRLA